MQYTVETQIDGTCVDTQGPFYWEKKALDTARMESRKYTSRGTIVVVLTNEFKRGYPKAFRMGRLYTI